MSFRPATAEEIERAKNPTADDLRYYASLQRSARAYWQSRDAKGRFSGGYDDHKETLR